MTDPIAKALAIDLSRILGRNVMAADLANTVEALRKVWIPPVALPEMNDRERAILEEVVSTLYLYGTEDKHNRGALRTIFRRLTGLEPDEEEVDRVRRTLEKAECPSS